MGLWHSWERASMGMEKANRSLEDFAKDKGFPKRLLMEIGLFSGIFRRDWARIWHRQGLLGQVQPCGLPVTNYSARSWGLMRFVDVLFAGSSNSGLQHIDLEP
jgi:hypothetical protein